jgi:hypothetical protein
MYAENRHLSEVAIFIWITLVIATVCSNRIVRDSYLENPRVTNWLITPGWDDLCRGLCDQRKLSSAVSPLSPGNEEIPRYRVNVKSW